MQKILEFKNLDWMKGISAQINVPVGGLFQQLSGCDPFEQGGVALPSQIPAVQPLGTTPKVLTAFNSGGNGYTYAQSDTKLYQVLNSNPFTVTDETSQIFQHLTSGSPSSILNAIIYQNAYVYCELLSSGIIEWYANTIPVASGSDVLIKSGVDGANGVDFMPMCEGPDGNLYCGNFHVIEELTNVSGTSGNSSHYSIDLGFTIRDLKSDGSTLVILADNNTLLNGSRVPGAYKCRIYFWDMVQQTGAGFIDPDAMYEWDDSYAIGMKMIDGGNSVSGNTLLVFTYNGIYITNVASDPRMLRPFGLASNVYFGRPLNPNQIVTSKGSTYWIDGTLSGSVGIMAYGNPTTGSPRIFYQPYLKNAAVLATCLSIAGTELILGTAAPELRFFNTGTARGTVTVQSLDTTQVQPHRYDATKVVLGRPLQSGESVLCQVFCQNHSQLISSETKSYSAAKPRQNLIFKIVPTGSNQPNKFEDIDVIVTSTGAPIQRVSVYATPLDDLTEDI